MCCKLYLIKHIMLFSCLLGHPVYKIQNFLDTIKFSNFIINCSFSKPRFVFVSSTIPVFSELILPEIISFIYVVTSRKLPNKCLSSSLNSRNFAKDLFNLQFTTYISKNGFLNSLVANYKILQKKTKNLPVSWFSQYTKQNSKKTICLSWLVKCPVWSVGNHFEPNFQP